MDYGHKSVLLKESIGGLHIVPGDIYVDGTLGSGGHAEEVAKRFGRKVKIVGIDMDEDAILRAKVRLEKVDADVVFAQGNFRDIDKILSSLDIPKVNRIMLDLGLSSNQLEESGRGFTFKKDEPLKMTFSKETESSAVTAEVVVNEWGEETLSTIFKGFGEERFAKKIAKAIVENREFEPIKTTSQLVGIIASAVPGWYQHQKIHFATRVFQAIRIAVNDELGAISEGLEKIFESLAKEGRLAVISFHSLEDRIVKNFFRKKASEDEAILITKKPIIPDDEEFHTNKRSRSAKLRIIEKK